jgi:predicted dehydrogenase
MPVCCGDLYLSPEWIRGMNVGLVGLGKMGLLHAGILNSINFVKLVAISEREKVIAKFAKRLLPGIHVYDEFEEMLDSEELDIVYVTTPVSSHYPIVSLCVKRQVNFFVEKPLVSDLKQATNLHRTLKGSPIIHSVGYNRRFTTTFSKTKSLLERGILGEVSYVKSSMYVSNILSKPTGWRFKKGISGGGVLLDLGAHVIDLLVWYFSPIREVSAKTKSLYSEEVEDVAHVDIDFADGSKGEIDTSWSAKGFRLPELNIEITGDRGRLRVNEDFIKVDLDSHSPYIEGAGTTIYKQSLNNEVPIDLGGPEYTKEDIHMIDCVSNGRQALVNAFEACKTQSILHSAYEASRVGKTKKVEYFD